jgi:membrane-associated phospholipid phosphatase
MRSEYFIHKKNVLPSFLVGLTLIFLSLSHLVLNSPPSHLDVSFTVAVQKHQSPALDTCANFISWFGYMPVSLIMVLLVATLFFISGFKREALYTLYTLISGLISTGTKILINRPRPTKDLVRILDVVRDRSFPSGHVLFYTLFFGMLILIAAKTKEIPLFLRGMVSVMSALMIVMVPLSRIYLGVHWLTDVFGGFILGLMSLLVLGYFYFQKQAH